VGGRDPFKNGALVTMESWLLALEVVEKERLIQHGKPVRAFSSGYFFFLAGAAGAFLAVSASLLAKSLPREVAP
jgi:hypothetical protein